MSTQDAAIEVGVPGHRLRRLSRQPNGTSPLLAPNPSRRLSQGALVEAYVRARVLGIPLLKVEAFVTLVPADVAARVSRGVEIRTRESARPAASRMRRSEPLGSCLAEAIRNLEEANDVLAAARRNGDSTP
jgi:hypothetical protein